MIPYLRSRRGQRIARVRSSGRDQVRLFRIVRYAEDTDVEDEDEDEDDLNSFIAALVSVHNVEELERALAEVGV